MKSIHFIDFLLTLLEIKKFLKESFFSCTLKSFNLKNYLNFLAQ